MVNQNHIIDPSEPVLSNGEQLSHTNFESIRKILYDVSGISLSSKKQNMVQNRIAKRKADLSLSTFDSYLAFLEDPKNSDEIIGLVNALTTNVTHFFRESHHFEHLKKTIKKLLRENKPEIVIWSAGCSIGAEPYSIAITAMDAMEEERLQCTLKILATDIDTKALKSARQGVYEEKFLKGISRHQMLSYFSKAQGDDENIYQINKNIRDKVSFNYLNFNDNPWPMKGAFDFIFCRNALIYFDSEKQLDYVGRMTDLLITGGFLYLGHSEYFISDSAEYEALGQTTFRKR